MVRWSFEQYAERLRAKGFLASKKQAGNQKVVGLKNVIQCAVLLTTAAFRSLDGVDLDV
jgi:hypothetical protein